MNSKDLTGDQALQVYLETRTMLGRVYKLKSRMDERGFETDDAAYAATVAAWESLVEMAMRWQMVAMPAYFRSNTTPDQPHPPVAVSGTLSTNQ